MSVSLDSSQIAKDKRSNSIATACFRDIGSLIAAKFSREFTGLLTAKSKKGAVLAINSLENFKERRLLGQRKAGMRHQFGGRKVVLMRGAKFY